MSSKNDGCPTGRLVNINDRRTLSAGTMSVPRYRAEPVDDFAVMIQRDHRARQVENVARSVSSATKTVERAAANARRLGLSVADDLDRILAELQAVRVADE